MATILFMTVTMALFIIMTQLYKERLTIAEQRDVLHSLEKAAYIVNDQEKKDTVEGIRQLRVNEYVVQLCLSWKGINGREYEHCLFAPKR